MDQIIEELRPKVAAVPGMFTFMQNPPPITVSGQNSASVLPAHSAEREPERDLRLGAASSRPKCAQLPGFVDVNQRHADLQPAVDGGYRPRPRRWRSASRRSRCRTRCSAPTAQRQVSVIYAPANQYSVILEVLPQYQRTPDALSKLYLRSSAGGTGAAWMPWCAPSARPGRCTSTTSASCPP